MAKVCKEAFEGTPKTKNIYYKMPDSLTMVVPYSKAFKNDWVCRIRKVKKGEKRNIKSDNFKSYIDWDILQ